MSKWTADWSRTLHPLATEVCNRWNANQPGHFPGRPLLEGLVSQAIEIAVQDWQPIATAPKDGTMILVSDGQKVAAAHCVQQYGFSVYCTGIGNLTCWQPLPPPPWK